MNPVRRLLGVLYISVAISAYDDSDLEFIGDFISHHSFYSHIYNLITCRHLDSINLIKMLSGSFQRFVVVHREDEPLSPILDKPQTFVLNLLCLRSREILRQAVHLNLFGKPHQWILFGNGIGLGIERLKVKFSDSETTSYWDFLETLPLYLDSDVKVIEKISKQKISVFGTYKISKNRSLLKEHLAEWTAEDRLTVLNPKVVAVRRFNLQGASIPASLVLTNPDSLNHLDNLIDKQVDTTTKVSFNVIKLSEVALNMSISQKVVDSWAIFDNGSWKGMLGDLEKGEVEIGGAPLFLQKNRLHIIEYFAMVNPTGSNFIFLSPPLSYSNNIFIMPFDTIVWFCCLGMVAVSCFLLFTALNMENYESDDEKSIKRKQKISFAEILILNIGAICLQGTVAQTKGPAGRIITLFLYFSYMFLYISYSAAIVAILQSSDTSIQTYKDILNSPLGAGAENISFSIVWFKTADDELRKTFYRVKIAPKGDMPHFLPPKEGIAKVRDGFYAFHVERSTGYEIIQKTFTEEEKCGLRETQFSFFKTEDPWLVMRRNTPYAEVFKISIKRIIEAGFKTRFVRRYYTKKPICVAKASRFVSVGMLDCSYAFALLGIGIGVAFGLLLVEVSVSKYLERRKKQADIKNSHFVPSDMFLD